MKSNSTAHTTAKVMKPKVKRKASPALSMPASKGAKSKPATPRRGAGAAAMADELVVDTNQPGKKILQCAADSYDAIAYETLRKLGIAPDAADYEERKRAIIARYERALAKRALAETTKNLTTKKLKSKRVKVDAKRRALDVKLATTPQWEDNLKIGPYFNYPLADEIAKAAVIKGAKEGDRGELRGVLRVIGHACALQENVAWMKKARELRLSCGTGRGKGRDRFDRFLLAILGGKPATNVTDYFTLMNCSDMVIAPRFNDAVADFIWRLTDPRVWAEAEQRQADWRAREKAIVEAIQAGREIPPSALTPEERKRALSEVVVDRHLRLGWSWKETAKELVELKLLLIESPGGKNTPDLEKVANFWAMIDEELPGLWALLRRLKKAAK